MIVEDLEFHNIDIVSHHKGVEGVLLERVPETVGKHLSKAGQLMMICPSGSEIRFVSDTYPVRVTLSVDKIADVIGEGEGHAEAHVFFGTFQSRQRFIIHREKTAVDIVMPHENFMTMAQQISKNSPFSPCVCRIRLWGRTMGVPIRFHHVKSKGCIRPPRPDELPKRTYLAYGSSVTQGAYASGPHLSYTSQAGCRLGADVINLGISCSAYCEPEMADYIAERKDWDFATLALSVNMVDRFSPDEFLERVRYMVRRIAESDSKRPVFCITIKPYYGDFLEGQRPDLYRNLLRQAVKEASLENLFLIEGPELMPDIAGGLGPDLIHLGDLGMVQIGENLAKKLRPILKAYDLLS
jgi:lysophospholipase L1-like esterase